MARKAISHLSDIAKKEPKREQKREHGEFFNALLQPLVNSRIADMNSHNHFGPPLDPNLTTKLREKGFRS